MLIHVLIVLEDPPTAEVDAMKGLVEVLAEALLGLAGVKAVRAKPPRDGLGCWRVDCS